MEGARICEDPSKLYNLLYSLSTECALMTILFLVSGVWPPFVFIMTIGNIYNLLSPKSTPYHLRVIFTCWLQRTVAATRSLLVLVNQWHAVISAKLMSFQYQNIFCFLYISPIKFVFIINLAARSYFSDPMFVLYKRVSQRRVNKIKYINVLRLGRL